MALGHPSQGPGGRAPPGRAPRPCLPYTGSKGRYPPSRTLGPDRASSTHSHRQGQAQGCGSLPPPPHPCGSALARGWGWGGDGRDVPPPPAPLHRQAGPLVPSARKWLSHAHQSPSRANTEAAATCPTAAPGTPGTWPPTRETPLPGSTKLTGLSPTILHLPQRWLCPQLGTLTAPDTCSLGALPVRS